MIVVDVETTGSNPYKHSIVSIGAVEFENPTNQFYEECRAFDGAEIDNDAMRVNGFTYDEITDPLKKSLEQIVSDFLNWCSGFPNKTLIAHNSGFDSWFLKASMDRYNLYWGFGFRTLDLHTMAYIDFMKKDIEPPLIYGVSSLSLNKILEMVGLPKEPDPHNALNGAKYETEAMYRLIYGKSILDEFKQYPIPNNLAKVKQASLF